MNTVGDQSGRNREVGAIAQQVASGTYRVDARDVASAILDRWASDSITGAALRDWYATYSEDAGTTSDSSD